MALSDIPYLEAAVGGARHMQRKIDLTRGGFDERRRYNKLGEQIDDMLDKLSPLYMQRHIESGDGIEPECGTPEPA